MKTIFDLKNSHIGKSALILGAGGTLVDYGEKIKTFIADKDLKIIGINNSVEFYVPDYHLWTNNGRLKEFGKNINSFSVLMFGSNIKKELIDKFWGEKYISVPYVDKDNKNLAIKDNIIQGHFRTAGCLAIVLCYIMGFDSIYIAGMDGYTLNNWSDLKENKETQHFYGKGTTDNNSYEICKKKDELVYKSLDSISSFGIKFSIITPSVFERYYSNIELADY